MSKHLRETLLGAAFAILLWQGLSMLIGHQILLASPISVIRRLSQLIREPGFLSTVFFSLGRITGGFLLGLSLGVLLSAVSARFSLSEIL